MGDEAVGSRVLIDRFDRRPIVVAVGLMTVAVGLWGPNVGLVRLFLLPTSLDCDVRFDGRDALQTCSVQTVTEPDSPLVTRKIDDNSATMTARTEGTLVAVLRSL